MSWRERVGIGLLAIPLAALVIYLLNRCAADLARAGR